MVIELCVVQFWSEIILVISNQTRAARSFDFEITRMISDQIALHSVQLPLLTKCVRDAKLSKSGFHKFNYVSCYGFLFHSGRCANFGITLCSIN